MTKQNNPPYGRTALISKLRYKRPCPGELKSSTKRRRRDRRSPGDMQARFLRLAERIASVGLESLSEPHVKHLEGKLWELRLTAAMELPARFTSRRSAAGSSWSAHSRRRHKKRRVPRSNSHAARKGNQMTIQFEKLKARLLANPKVKAEYDALGPEFEIAAELLRARLRAGLSQAELAARMGTSQSTIARLKMVTRSRAPRRSCATPRQPAADFTCGYAARGHFFGVAHFFANSICFSLARRCLAGTADSPQHAYRSVTRHSPTIKIPRKELLRTRNLAEYPFKKVPDQFPERRDAPIVFPDATRGEAT